VTGVSCRLHSRRLEITASARADCEAELDGARKKGDLFERVFDRGLSVKAVAVGSGEAVHQRDLEIVSADALWN
jgi:hypothetical protein